MRIFCLLLLLFLVFPSFGDETNAVSSSAKKTEKKKHVNPADYDDLANEGLCWGGWDGRITGRVIDKYMKPIPFAKVKIHSKDLETVTDKDGNFTIGNLQVGGHYSLIISARGMEPGVARWIPIPVMKEARIGDFSIETEKLWTNFWVVVTNRIVKTETDALSNSYEKVILNCVSNYYDVVDGETNVYDYTEWYFRYHLNYMERNVLESLGVTNVPKARAELIRRGLGFGSDGRPLEPKPQEEETEEKEAAGE